MSITLTTQMFSMLSASSQKEIIASFALPSLISPDEIDTSPMGNTMPTQSCLPPWKPSTASTTIIGSAFDSASLSFSKPLELPKTTESFELKKKTIRHATKVPVALSSDLYSIATSDVIDEITSDIDLGYFLGPSTWLRGQRHHPENFDVRRVINILRKNGPSNSYKINMSLLTLCRYRIAAILRQLRIQGIVTAKPAFSEEFKNVYKI